MTEYQLGRVQSQPDPRDHSFSMYRNLLRATPATFIPTVLSPVLDQGQTPECVAYSGSAIRCLQERSDEKLILTFDSPELYARCKEQDGAPTQDGTEIRVAAQILKDRGAKVLASPNAAEVGTFKPIAAYARLNTIDEIKSTVLLDGATWIGVDWYNSWFNPTPLGDLPAPDTIAGGHAISIIGWDDTRDGGSYYIQNNWGANWGLSGRAWIKYSYLDFTGADEAWSTVDVIDAPKPVPPTPTPTPGPTPPPVPDVTLLERAIKALEHAIILIEQYLKGK